MSTYGDFADMGYLYSNYPYHGYYENSYSGAYNMGYYSSQQNMATYSYGPRPQYTPPSAREDVNTDCCQFQEAAVEECFQLPRDQPPCSRRDLPHYAQQRHPILEELEQRQLRTVYPTPPPHEDPADSSSGASPRVDISQNTLLPKIDDLRTKQEELFPWMANPMKGINLVIILIVSRGPTSHTRWIASNVSVCMSYLSYHSSLVIMCIIIVALQGRRQRIISRG